MEAEIEKSLERPRMVRRHCGGWLALSPEGAGLKIGVVAHTEEMARQKFEATLTEWRETLALGKAPQ